MADGHVRRSIANLVKVALNLRLFALLLTILWLPTAETTNLRTLTLLLAVVGATSLVPILMWDRVAPFVLAHPAVIVVDLVVALAILGLVGLNTPFGLFVLSTGLVAGALYGWIGALVITVGLAGIYAAGAMLDQAVPTIAELFGTPMLVPVAAAGGAAMRGLLLQQHASEEALAESAMQTAAARERTRLAREMHDTLAKTLHGLALTASAVPRLLDDQPRAAADAASRLAETAERAAHEARGLIVDLRTDDLERPLGTALHETITTWCTQTGVVAEVDLDACPGLSPSVRYELFCIAREALRNAHEHGQAARVYVTLRDGEQVHLSVRDDGAGFTPPADLADLTRAGHFGVIGMAERAQAVGGTLQVRSRPGAGTTVEATVPVTAPGDRPGQLPPRLDSDARSTA